MLKASKVDTSARRSWLPMSGPARRPSDHAGIRDHDAGIGDHHVGISDHPCPESLIIMPERAITMDWNWRSHSTGMRDHNGPDYALQRAGFAVGRKKVFNAGYRAAHIVTGQLVSGRTARLPRNKRANVRANVDEVICRYESGLPNSSKAMNRLRGRLQYLRTNGHQRDTERLIGQLAAAGITLLTSDRAERRRNVAIETTN
jgi:hypothetical protein